MAKDYPKTERKGLPPRHHHRIKLRKARDYIRRYRRGSPGGEHGGFFHLKPVLELLAQPGCAGMRYYHGVDGDGDYHLILVAVDGEGKDILHRAVVTTPRAGAKMSPAGLGGGGGEAILLDDHYRCPPWCPPTEQF
jgi:hypothetical protein